MAVHVVTGGESLWSISSMYGVSVATIMQVNGLLNANAIVPGLALYIPDNNLAFRFYQIQAGDTLWQLAQRFDSTTEQIVSANPQVNLAQLYIGQEIVIPSPHKLEIETLGFIVPYNPQQFLASLDDFAEQLTYIAIVSYSFTAEGYAYNILEDRDIISASLSRNIRPLLMIRNFTVNDFDRVLVGAVLGNPSYRHNLVLSLLNFITERGYAGVSIDFEFIPPPHRNDFIDFLTELKSALGNLILHVNVHAKTADIPTNPIIGAYDYRAIGEIADIVAVMTIDYGYPTGPPDPISPAWWVAQVIRYSLTQIEGSKLQIAMPLYGYDKNVATNATRALSVLDAQNLAISIPSSIQFDSLAQSPWFRYRANGDEQVVWFEDIRSFMAKYRLIDLYQIRGTTFWQLSLPAPQNWHFLKNQIDVVREADGPNFS